MVIYGNGLEFAILAIHVEATYFLTVSKQSENESCKEKIKTGSARRLS